MKKLSETYKELGIAFTFPIEIRNENGKGTYYETRNGFWSRSEYDEDGKRTYRETSTGYKKGTKRGSCSGKVIEVDSNNLSDKSTYIRQQPMEKLIPKSLDGLIKDYLSEGAKLFMFQPYREEHALFIEHRHGDVTIASWVEGRGEVSYLNISKDIRNNLANDLSVKEDLTQ